MRPCSRRYAWWAMESASRCKHLLLAARKGAGGLAGALLQNGKTREHRVQVRFHAGAVPPEPDVGAGEKVLTHRHVREDEAVLGHQRDPTPDDVGGRSPRQLPSLEGDRAAPRPEDPRDGVEQGRLAGAVGAQDAGDLALARREAHAPE